MYLLVVILVILFIVIVLNNDRSKQLESSSRKTNAENNSKVDQLAQEKKTTETLSTNKEPQYSSKPLSIAKQKKLLTIAEKRKTNPHAYESWSYENDQLLKKLHSEGKSVNELSKLLGRNHNSINARLRKLKINKSSSNLLIIKKAHTFNLYHFTDSRNIPSIRKYGLLSWYELLNRNILHFPASNDLSRNLDIRHNLQDYVRLSLNQNHPMFSAAKYYKRVEKLVWLKIDPEVVELPGSLFSNENATSNKVIVSDNIETAVKSSSDQAEVLIKNRIDSKYIIFPL